MMKVEQEFIENVLKSEFSRIVTWLSVCGLAVLFVVGKYVEEIAYVYAISALLFINVIALGSIYRRLKNTLTDVVFNSPS